jgi:hypothetical protein
MKADQSQGKRDPRDKAQKRDHWLWDVNVVLFIVSIGKEQLVAFGAELRGEKERLKP